jgi:hypothetical protein
MTKSGSYAKVSKLHQGLVEGVFLILGPNGGRSRRRLEIEIQVEETHILEFMPLHTPPSGQRGRHLYGPPWETHAHLHGQQQGDQV